MKDITLEEATKLAILLGATRHSLNNGQYRFYTDEVRRSRHLLRYCVLFYNCRSKFTARVDCFLPDNTTLPIQDLINRLNKQTRNTRRRLAPCTQDVSQDLQR